MHRKLAIPKEPQTNPETGFTLLELVISMALLLVIGGAAIGALNFSQKGYRQSEVEGSLHQQMRGALEQMEQEITQAGLVSTGMEEISAATGPVTTLKSAVSPGSTSISVNSAAGFFVGENLWLDGGSLAEPVTIGAISYGNPPTFTLNVSGPNTSGISASHAAGAAVIPRGVFPAGILPPGTPNGSTNQSLGLIGDINNNGTLEYIRYDCPGSGNNATTSLVRSTWNMQANTTGAWTSNKVPLLDNVTYCNFIYTYTYNVTRTPDTSGNYMINAPDDPNGTLNTASTSRFYLTDGTTFPQFVLSVGISVTSCQQTPNLVGSKQICLSKSFLNIQPRNVLAGYYQAVEAENSSNQSLLLDLQPTPTALLPTSAP